MRPRSKAVLAALVLIAALAPCSRAPGPDDVLLITLDTTRPDFLSPYGSDRSRTPVLDSLAAAGALFERAYAPVPVTRPSHASILTGRYPRAHGVWGNQNVLPDAWPTLATILKSRGYRTAAAVSTGLFLPGSGFERGFDRLNKQGRVVKDPDTGGFVSSRRADATIATAIEYLKEGLSSGEPFFLWVHLYDAHFPYAPPESFAEAPEKTPFRRVKKLDRPTLKRLTRKTGGDVTAPMLDRFVDLYAGEIEFMDARLADLFAALRELGAADRTLVVVVADHGEEFDHGVYFRHGTTVHEGDIAIPLLFVRPGRIAPARITSPVSAVDVTPTILDLLGVEAPDGMQGVSLAPAFRGGAVPDHPVFFSIGRGEVTGTPEEIEQRKENRDKMWEDYRSVMGVERRDLDPHVVREGVIRDRWKLVLREGEAKALFDIGADPGETRSRLREQPARVESLRALYDEFLATTPDAGGADPVDLSDEEKSRLRSLGYLD